MLSANIARTFSILALNSFLHLAIDGLQTKLANGVHFLAPFEWAMVNLELFWPEDVATILLTAYGLAFFAVNMRTGAAASRSIRRPRGRICAGAVLAALYLASPLLFLSGPEQADNHFVRTLRARCDRVGAYVEFDRVPYVHRTTGSVLRTFAGEELDVDGIDLNRSVTVSVRATFTAEDRIHVEDYHVHFTVFRDLASYLGLMLVATHVIYARMRLVRTT